MAKLSGTEKPISRGPIEEGFGQLCSLCRDVDGWKPKKNALPEMMPGALEPCKEHEPHLSLLRDEYGPN